MVVSANPFNLELFKFLGLAKDSVLAVGVEVSDLFASSIMKVRVCVFVSVNPFNLVKFLDVTAFLAVGVEVSDVRVSSIMLI